MTLLGGAVGLLLAALLELALPGRDDHRRVLVLCVLAIAVAIGRAGSRRNRWSGPATEVALVALIAVGLGLGRGPSPWLYAGVGAGMGLCGLLAWRVGRRGPGHVGAAGAVVAAGLAVGATQVPWDRVPWDRVGLPVHSWNQVHYVLGTKYFDELGYHDLYNALLLADEEGPRRLLHVTRVRDMHTYKPLTRTQALAMARRPDGPRARFTDARWAALQHDLEVFQPLLPPSTWRAVLTDLGYNPSPVWVVIHRPLLQRIDLDGRTLELLAALQVPMYAGVLALSWWAFGRRATLWLVLWNVLFFGNRGRLYGGYWSYDWLALVVAGTAMIVRGRPVAAAAAVAVGGLMRGFGGLLALGPTVHGLAAFLSRGGGGPRWRRPDPWTTRFLLALALGMLLLGAASLGTARGPGAWTEWGEKISLHSARISTGGRHLGLKVLFGEDWSVPGHEADLGQRRRIYTRQAWAYHLAQVLLVGWTLLVMRRRGRLDAALLGFIPAFALMVLSRYYYAAWGVLLLLGRTGQEDEQEGRPAVQVAMLGLLALHEGQFLVPGTTPDSRHQVVNLALLGLAVVTLAVYTGVDLRHRWRTRRQPLAPALQ